MALEWDFTVPAPAPAVEPETEPQPSERELWRPVPTTDGRIMVACIGCGDPMTLAESLRHDCELPPPGWL